MKFNLIDNPVLAIDTFQQLRSHLKAFGCKKHCTAVTHLEVSEAESALWNGNIEIAPLPLAPITYLQQLGTTYSRDQNAMKQCFRCE